MPRGRPRKELSLRLHKATGVWYVTDPDRHRERYFTKNRDESQVLFEQWLLERARQREHQEARQNAQTPPSRTSRSRALIINTVADVFNVYLDWLRQHGKDLSFQDTRRLAKEFGRHIPLKANLDTLAKKDFRAYRDDLWELVSKKGFKRSYANRRIRIIRAAFRRAYKECDEMLNGEAIQAMLSVLETRQERDTVGAAAIEASEFHAIAEGDDLQWKTIMYLAMNCALGNTDIASIERKHIDLEQGRISFARVKTAESADRQRHTPLWPESLALLREHMALSRSQRLLFATVRGDAWLRVDTHSSNDELSKKFRKICIRLGIQRKGLSFYSIRHAAAEWAADTPGVDSMGVKFLLGHATPEMWGKYVTKTPERLRLAVEGIHQKLFNHPGSQESSVSEKKPSAAKPGSDPPAFGNPGSKDKPEETPG